jgi:hypothetical protein
MHVEGEEEGRGRRRGRGRGRGRGQGSSRWRQRGSRSCKAGSEGRENATPGVIILMHSISLSSSALPGLFLLLLLLLRPFLPFPFTPINITALTCQDFLLPTT